ncbi:MAG: Mor transcription activator family protein [Ruminiclostridium sp.]
MDLLNVIKPEHLAKEQQEIAELIGIEAYRKLMDVYGGEKIYIPKPETVIKKNRNELIKASFDGSNHQEIRKEFGISIRELDRILHGLR